MTGIIYGNTSLMSWNSGHESHYFSFLTIGKRSTLRELLSEGKYENPEGETGKGIKTIVPKGKESFCIQPVIGRQERDQG